MKKFKKVLSSATLLSVGGFGLFSYVNILDPNQEYVEPTTYEGYDGIEYDSIQEAANTFAVEDYTYYVEDGITFNSYDEYEAYQLNQITESDIYNINGSVYEEIEDIYEENKTEQYSLYKTDYVKTEELFDIAYEDAVDEFDKQTHHLISIPSRVQERSSNQWQLDQGAPGNNPEYHDNWTVLMDIDHDQSYFEGMNLSYEYFVLPDAHIHELDELQLSGPAGLVNCKSSSIHIIFSSAYAMCSDLRIVKEIYLYEDFTTNEKTTDLHNLATKRANVVKNESETRLKFMNNYYKDQEDIKDFIESLKEKRFEWNNNFYSNRDVITNNIFIHFKGIEEDIRVDETRLCNDEIIDTNNKEEYLLNNYDLLVNRCIYGNISM